MLADKMVIEKFEHQFNNTNQKKKEEGSKGTRLFPFKSLLNS